MEQKLQQLPESVERPRLAAAVVDDILVGQRRLGRAFMQTPLRISGCNRPLLRAGASEASAILIRSGFAFRSRILPDGRRVITRILLAGDFAGLDNIFLSRTIEDVHAARTVSYYVLRAATLHTLLNQHCISKFILAQMTERRWQADRLATGIGRLDAYARLCVLFLDIHDRLRRRKLITQPTFELPFTQEQLADHLGLTLVHVNRTLRRLREQRIVFVDRQIVTICDIGRLREFAQGIPQIAEFPERDIARGELGQEVIDVLPDSHPMGIELCAG